MTGLRFGFITTFYPPWNFGGDGIAIQRLSQALARRGHQVTVVHDADAYRALAGGDPPAAEPEPSGIEVVTLKSRLGVVSPLLSQQIGRPVVHGRHIARILAARQCDVINFHNVSLVGGPGLFRLGHGVKLYMAHEHWLVCPTHVLWRHRREICTGRQCLRCQWRYRRPPQWWRWTGLLARELQHVDAFIAMSEFSRAKHREFGFPREMEVLAPLPPARASTRPPDPDPPRPAAGRPYFLYVGRLERMKGVQDLLPHFGGADPPDLLIAGNGTAAPMLKEAAARLPRVRLLGMMPPEVLEPLYQHALAVLAPAIGFETFGLTLLEAWQHGTPVIARRLGPFPELIDASGAGLLFETAGELGEALQRLAHDPALRQRLGASGRRAVASRWSEDALLAGYLDIAGRAAQRRGMHPLSEQLRRGSAP